MAGIKYLNELGENLQKIIGKSNFGKVFVLY